MSKDSSAGGGSSIGFEELLRMNPALIEQMQQSNMPSMPATSPQEPVMVRDMTTPQAIESFYGSGTEIVQPDQSYFQDFALPGVQMDRPETAAESEDRETARQKAEEEARYAAGGSMSRTQPADTRSNYQMMLEGAYQPDARARNLGYRSSGSLRAQGLLGYQQPEQVPADEGMGVAPSMPILDFAGGNTAYMGAPDFRNFNMRGMR